MINLETIAGQLYDEYCYAVGGQAYDGKPLPDWTTFYNDPTKEVQRNAWIQVARKAVTVLAPPSLPPEPTTFQERVMAEKRELDAKRSKLAAFIGTDAHAALPEAEQDRLRLQLDAMNTYSVILGDRVVNFKT